MMAKIHPLIPRSPITSLWVIFLCWFLSGCGAPNQWIFLKGKTMGTTYSIKAYTSSELDEVALQKELDQKLLDFDLEMSNWNPKSWVNRFNASTNTQWQAAPPHALAIISSSLELHQKSRGAFDITISPLIEIWGFGVQEQDFPKPEAIAKSLSQMGAEDIELDLDNRRIRKRRGEITINCSAIAKGYGVDLIASTLADKGIRDIMVEIGGEVRVMGKAKGRDHWNIGIRQPKKNSDGAGLHSIVPLQNQSMATSGDYHNFFRRHGKRYSHVLDPSSGQPVEHALCSVTVIAPSCALADGLATACLVLGTQTSLQWIKQFPNCEAYFIERLEDDSLKVYQTPNFPQANP